MEEKLVTLGEKRARVNKSPNESDYEHNLRVAAAEFIDTIERSTGDPKLSENQFQEWERLKNLAMDAAEVSLELAVKAATY
jgi:hypothetical protein